MNGADQASPYYPIFLNIRGKRCVVVGGGLVALRKVKALIDHGAKVEVISPELCPELSQMAQNGTIRLQRRSYDSGDLEGAVIAIAATDDGETNNKVAEEARAKGVLINVVDDLEHSDFIVPAQFHRGDITIAVSTAGRSPALARKIRTKLEKDFGVEYALLVRLIGEVRSELKQQGIKVNRNCWQEAIDLDELIGLLRSGQSDKAKATLRANLERLRQTKT